MTRRTDEAAHFRAWTDPSIAAARRTIAARGPVNPRDVQLLAVVGAAGWSAGLFCCFSATSMSFIAPGPLVLVALVVLLGSIPAAGRLAYGDRAEQQRRGQPTLAHPATALVSPALYLGRRMLASPDPRTGHPFWVLVGLSVLGSALAVIAQAGLYAMWTHGY